MASKFLLLIAVLFINTTALAGSLSCDGLLNNIAMGSVNSARASWDAQRGSCPSLVGSDGISRCGDYDGRHVCHYTMSMSYNSNSPGCVGLANQIKDYFSDHMTGVFCTGGESVTAVTTPSKPPSTATPPTGSRPHQYIPANGKYKQPGSSWYLVLDPIDSKQLYMAYTNDIIPGSSKTYVATCSPSGKCTFTNYDQPCELIVSSNGRYASWSCTYSDGVKNSYGTFALSH